MTKIPMRFSILVAMVAIGVVQLIGHGALSQRTAVGSVPEAEARLVPTVQRSSAGVMARVLTALRAPRTRRYARPVDHPRPPLGHFKVTAYSGPQVGGAYPITASGTRVRAGRTVAVDPKVIPLGSRLYIDGIGERIAEDTGGKVKGNHIDLYVPSVPQARRFGVQRAKVTLLALPEKRG